MLPRNVEGTHARLKRLVKLGIHTEADTGNPRQEVMAGRTSTSVLDPTPTRTDVTSRTAHG